MADENFTVVSVLDPGIDTKRMTTAAMRVYTTTRDADALKQFVVPGATVAEYRCREIPHTLWEGYVMAGASDAERLKRAFQCGVTNVKHLRQRDGSTVPSWDPPQVNGVMADESLGRFSAAVRAEIGQVIWQRSFLAPMTVPIYLLPDTVLACLAGREFLPVESSPNSPETSSDEASSGLAAAEPTQATPSTTGNETATCGDGSAAPTDATAAERSTSAA